MGLSVAAIVKWPNASLTDSLVRKALNGLDAITFVDSPSQEDNILQWSSYDCIAHELTLFRPQNVLSSSYTFRKALIRKHFLSRVIHSYVTKYPHSILKDAFPQTYNVELSFADELDEMWTDELWELGHRLEAGQSWWILKPGMADRGMGIRIFYSKIQLQQIFEEFEACDSEDDVQPDSDNGTSVMISQLRNFVIQEYVASPLLLNPSQVPPGGLPNALRSHKVLESHPSLFCALRVYLYKRILALFAPTPYVPPSASSAEGGTSLDLTPHLTNTSLQTQLGEMNVKLFDELIGSRILSEDGEKELSVQDLKNITDQVSQILSECFKAALQNPVHFQPALNAFELYGVDFLVAHDPSNLASPFQVKLLEVNAEPAIELTGPRLTWILEDLFLSIRKVCVEPFFLESQDQEIWPLGGVRHNFVKCVDEAVRGPLT